MARDERSLTIEELLAEAGWVRRLARGLVRDPHLAEDLSQEAMLVALRQPPAADVKARAWLRGVVRNLAAAWARGDAHRRQREARREPEAASAPEDLAQELELQRLLAGALLELGEPYRRTVHERYYRGRSSAEIARREGVPEGTVRWRLKRGLDQLRARLDEEHPQGRHGWLALVGALPETPEGGALAGGAALAAGPWALAGLLALLAALAAWSALGRTGARGVDTAAVARTASALDSGRDGAEIPSARPAGARAEAAPPRVRLAARAVDEDGRPLPGARLRALGGGEATSGGDGALALELPAAPRYALELSAPDRLPRRVDARWRGEARLELGELELRGAGHVFGRVLRADGGPAAGAEVLVDERAERAGLGPTRAAREWSYLGSMLPASAARARCDEAGRYELALPAGRYVHLWARAPGSFAVESPPLALALGERREGPELRLCEPAPGELLEGRVLRPDGAPAAGARVRAWRASRPELRGGPEERVYDVVAGQDGRFSLPVNPNPLLELVALDPTGRFGESELARARGGARGVELRLAAPRAFELRATDADGRALKPLEVELRDAASGARLARADLLPSAPFLCRIRAAGFREATLGPLDPAALGRPLEVALERAPTLRGLVLGAAGGGATVALSYLEPAGSWRASPGLALGGATPATRLAPGAPTLTVATDARGGFELALERDAPIALRAFDDAGAAVLALERPDAARALELRLEPFGALEGVVLVDAGRSPAGVLVAASDGLGGAAVARSDERGRFRLTRLAPGRWRVAALAREPDDEARPFDGAGAARLDAAPEGAVQVAPGASAWAELDLRARAGFALEGELLLDGAPPGPWRVELAPLDAPGERAAQGELDPRGRFRLEAGRGGAHELRLWPPSATQPRLTLVERVELAPGTLRWSAALETGRVSWAGGRGAAPEGLALEWRGAGALRARVPLPPGALERSGALRLPAGALRLMRREADGAERTLRELELAPGAELALE